MFIPPLPVCKAARPAQTAWRNRTTRSYSAAMPPLLIRTAAGALAGCGVFALLAAGLFDPLHERMIDARLRAMPAAAPEPSLHIIGIRDLAGRGWPWPRLDYALILRAITPFQPAVVGIEVPLDGADTFFANYDYQLAQALERFPRAVLSAAALSTRSQTPQPGHLIPIPCHGSVESLPLYQSAFWPFAAFARQARIGPANLVPDRDGLVRRAPLVFRFGSQVFPSWALLIYGQHAGVDWKNSEIVPGRSIRLRGPTGEVLRDIPVDSSGAFRIRYRPRSQPPAEFEFWNTLLASEQRLSGSPPVVDLTALRQKAVLIGRLEPTIAETVPTPQGDRLPFEIQMEILHNIYQKDWFRPSPWFWNLPVVLLAGAAAALASGLRSRRTALLVPLLLLATSPLFLLTDEILWPWPAVALAILLGAGTGWLLRNPKT